MSKLSYKDAGVDIDKKMNMIGSIGAKVATTFGPDVLHELGSFGGMYDGRFPESDQPILVATNDGVGTKVRTAVQANRVRGLGHDIVNHCVNDILVQGATPLFFMDYFASSRLDPEVFSEVVEGLVEACQAAGAALLGGETAEMPGVYCDGEFDIVGFIVGKVDRKDVLPRNVDAGDVLIGLRSDGLHTNGFSLVNKLLERDAHDLDAAPESLGESLAEALLRPHRSYLNPVMAVNKSIKLHALAHITGGGIQDNLPRVLPDGVGARIDLSSWNPNPIFEWILNASRMGRGEAYHVFNMGCGMIAVVGKNDASAAVQAFTDAGEEAWVLGELTDSGEIAFES